MPRDGSNIYHRPAGTDGVPDTPIESAKYNAYIADVEQDLNLPRPIVAGGTGATNATDAMTALGGELANQVVTNYDSDPILPGSFYSATSATGSPVTGHAFVGFAYGQTSGGLVIEARDLTDTNNPHVKYTRSYAPVGGWSTWKVDGRTIIGSNEGISGANADMFFGVTGTTPTSSFIVNDKADASGTNLVAVTKAGAATFTGALSVGGALTSGPHTVTGTLTASGAVATGALTVTGTIAASGNLTAPTAAISGALSSGALTVTGGVAASSGITAGGELKSGSGIVRLSADNTKYVYWDGSRYNMPGAPLQIGGPADSNSATTVAWVTGWAQPAGSYQANLGFTPARQGGGPFQAGNTIQIGWDGTGIRLAVDGGDRGRIFTDQWNGAATNGRMAYAGDTGVLDGWSPDSMREPNGGTAAVTGWQWSFFNTTPIINVFRMRIVQLLINGGWVTVGTA